MPNICYCRGMCNINEIKKNKIFYLFLLPTVAYFIIIKYFPIYFLQTAFREYNVVSGLENAKWVGFKFFKELFQARDFALAMKNTLVISVLKILWGFPAPIILALLLNELKNQKFKRSVQTIIYLPHFISWVIIGGLVMKLLAFQGGVVNPILKMINIPPQAFMVDQKFFRSILVISSIWKEAGWGTIIYLAAMSDINPEQYESAIIDGANRFQQVRFITIPGIVHVIVILLILRVGHILNVGFDQIMILYPRDASIMRDKGLVLEYFIYYSGLNRYRFSFSTAAGIFQTVIAFIMVLGSDLFAKRLGQRGIF